MKRDRATLRDKHEYQLYREDPGHAYDPKPVVEKKMTAEDRAHFDAMIERSRGKVCRGK